MAVSLKKLLLSSSILRTGKDTESRFYQFLVSKFRIQSENLAFSICEAKISLSHAVVYFIYRI